MKKSYVQIDGKLIPKEEVALISSDAPLIMGDIEQFVSPITKEVIRGRRHLRQHMKEHGVTHAQDYSEDWYAKRKAEIRNRIEREGRRERIELLKHALGD